MREVLYIDEVEQASVLLRPFRIDLLRRLDEPHTCGELAALVGKTPQFVYYHVKALEKAGLVEKVAERRVHGILEGTYQARARSYWLAPRLVGTIGGRRAAQDQMSLRFLLSLAEELHDDVGRLGQQVGREVPSLGLAAEVVLPEAGRRAAFLADVQRLFEALARAYGVVEDDQSVAATEHTYRLLLACYPREAAPPA